MANKNDEINPMGFGYLADDDKKKPENKIEKTEPKAEESAPEEIYTTQESPQETKPASGGFFSRLKNVLKPKPKAPVQQPKAQPVSKPVNEDKQSVEPEEVRSIVWRVPSNTKSVRVQVMEPNGRLINEYTISNFIKLEAGQKLKVIAD